MTEMPQTDRGPEAHHRSRVAAAAECAAAECDVVKGDHHCGQSFCAKCGLATTSTGNGVAIHRDVFSNHSAERMTTETELTTDLDLDDRYELAARVESEATIRRLTGPDGKTMPRERALMIVRLAARNIRADETNTLTPARAIADVRTAEFNEVGDPQRFPYDDRSTAAVRAMRALDTDDHSDTAETIREVGQMVRDHRAAYRLGHTINCRGDLRRGYCH